MSRSRPVGFGLRPVVLPARWQPVLETLFWAALASCYLVFPDKLNLFAQIMITGLFAVSLDMALGYAGILTVGHAVFFGIGAYCTGLLSLHGWGEPVSAALAAMVVCAGFGALLSPLIVRGADLTRLMITIAVCVLFTELANQATGITGGSDGLQGVEIGRILGLFAFDLYGRTAFLYAFGMVLLAFLVVRLILRSPFGLVLRGIHDNRKRMLAIGSPVNTRLAMAYAFSAAFAGLAGALLTQVTQFVGLQTISFDKSAEVLIILVLGGTGRLYGGMVGAIVYMLLHDMVSDLSPEYWMFWLGIFLIVVVMIGRGGLLGGVARLFKIAAR